MKNSLLKKLVAVIIASVFFIVAANAQIVYTDVKPDTTLSVDGSVYNLDLNNDGITDFKFQTYTSRETSSNCSGTRKRYVVYVTPIDKNEVLDSNWVGHQIPELPSTLSANTILSSIVSGHEWKKDSNQIMVQIIWTCAQKFGGFNWINFGIGGPWSETSIYGEYLGLKFYVGSNIYFGWVRLSAPNYGGYITVKDYAYNSIPNQPILAGQKNDFNWIVTVTAPPYCTGSNKIRYIASGKFNKKNVFTAQLSDSGGSFINPIIIGNKKDTVTGIIHAVIPSGTIPGTKYRVRVISSNPLGISFDNGTDMPIGAVISTNRSPELCPNEDIIFSASHISGYSYQWLHDGVRIDDATASTYYAAQVKSTGSYQCIITNTCSIDTSNTIVVTVSPLPKANITASGPTKFCEGGNVTLNANTGLGLTYRWYSTFDIPGATTSSYIADTTGEYKVLVTNKNGCYKLSNNIVVTVPEVPKVSIVHNDTSFCPGDGVYLTTEILNWSDINYKFQWKKDGINIPGVISGHYSAITYYATTAGTYTCNVTNECGGTTAKGVTLTTKQCKGLFSNVVTNDNKIISPVPQLKIYPNPLSNSTNISFFLPQLQKVSIQIFDMQGRLLKILADAQMQAGTHQLMWNTRDEKGNAVSTGIYFLKMQAGNYVETKKIVVEK